ncbi:MAG: type II toxin-antitoxin system PemK/MazF family toxin [Burkholderiales bacterium]|nr:MAG: type II toxin-antitoxin system PemK/MazF family toxin [Burkholderiales bacterium]
MRTPDRGQIWHLDLEPARGSEQRGSRYVFVVSPASFNRSGLALVCPITQGGHAERFAGFAETLSGTGLGTQGVIQCSHIRALDWRARGARHRENAPVFVTDGVLARLAPLVS